MGGFAWVTLATNDSYSLGALVLAHSLKQAGTAHQLAVLVTPGVTSAMREKLANVFNVVQEVNILDSRDEANLRLLKRPELGITFTKLHCWRLTQFEKCVFLDADTLVLQNADELFEREELSAAPDVGWPDCFNSGVFVYRPALDTFEKLVQFALEKGSFDGGDQGLLNLYFSDWAHKDISKHLPFIYNMCSTACYSYLPAFKQFGAHAKIIHFIGAQKPWLQYFNTETKKVQPSGDSSHLQAVLQRWWDIFCTLIHPHLSPAMAGLAAAFSQLTLGVPRTTEQDAFENVLRKQAWEVGNVDYLGKDSFENIWEKISQTLSSESSEGPPPPEPKPAPAETQSQTAPQEEAPQPPVSPPEILTDKSSQDSPKIDSSESSSPVEVNKKPRISPATEIVQTTSTPDQPNIETVTSTDKSELPTDPIKISEDPVKAPAAPKPEQVTEAPSQVEEEIKSAPVEESAPVDSKPAPSKDEPQPVQEVSPVKSKPEAPLESKLLEEEPLHAAVEAAVDEKVSPKEVELPALDKPLETGEPKEPPKKEETQTEPKPAPVVAGVDTAQAPTEVVSDPICPLLPKKDSPEELKETAGAELKQPLQETEQTETQASPETKEAARSEPPKSETSAAVERPEAITPSETLAAAAPPELDILKASASPKTKVTEPTPPTTPSTPPLDKTKVALSAEASVPETPPPSEGGSTPTPPPRKTDKPKKAAAKPKK
ncbi:unnamed protein product [Ceutorhynchus assimilis]|uniref:glycogenin glucosyltransferase n=1 Tax=Ceutorhynchus assimilis TaxID=467358 RepID=A0A9P0DGA1_9CUCU|nr:unnamed protein product [Ceutorhynchus assimilis]